MEYLVSGANGFIGKALCQELSRKGQKVTALPREYLHKEPTLSSFLAKVRPDVIVHLAAYGNKYDQQEEEKIVKANIEGTWNLLKASKAIPYKAFINVGSSSEYGTKQRPMGEGDSLDTDTFYGATKASATLLCRAFAKKYGKPVVTVRPFSVYGEEDDPSKFIPTVIRCFKTNAELTLAPGVHDWVHINDFIKALMVVIKNAQGLKGRVVNIGSGRQTSNFEVTAILREILGVPGNIAYTYDKMRDYDTTQMWLCDNSLIRSLGWNPEMDLEEHLERMVMLWKE